MTINAQEHAKMAEAMPLLEELQSAIKAAMEAEVPLAAACYRADAVDTLRELAAHFRGQTGIVKKRVGLATVP